MPANAKRPEDRERRNMPAELPSGVALPPPPAPTGLSAVLRRRWVALWSSPVAPLLDPDVDGPVVARLFELYALGDVLGAEIKRARADGEGLAAAVGARVRVATETRMLEGQLGLSPRSRLALGVMLMAAGRKRMAGAAVDAEDDDDY